MTDAQPAGATQAAGDADPAKAAAPAEWKPEPRQWTWKDLFTAPMLAFKPKCMVVSAVTLLLMGALAFFYRDLVNYDQTSHSIGAWLWPIFAVVVIVELAFFGIGATLVATFMKADLLDDEFLSLREALAAFKDRFVPALLVPIFLVVLLVVAHGLLVWLPSFIASTPYAGGFLYALFYPLGFAAAVFAILLLVAVAFSMFVFPAIVAIRRHGWFDNVVDTIEAVGTRPHILIVSLLLTAIMGWVTMAIAFNATSYMTQTAMHQPTWGASAPLLTDSMGPLPAQSEPVRSEIRGREISVRALGWIDPRVTINKLSPWLTSIFVTPPLGWVTWQGPCVYDGIPASEGESRFKWGSGLILGFWQTTIGALILGYCLNLFISGGMLTYLWVREDDYWDDEDLEDLDKLAKELEEEAKKDAGAPAVEAAPKTT